MTDITKPVKRRTKGTYNVLYCSPRHARRVVVSIIPGDILEFREHGRRMRWHLAIDSAFKYAVRCKVAADIAAKRAARKAKKKGGCAMSGDIYRRRLEAKVRAQNRANTEAMRLHPLFVEHLRPYVGKKIIVNGGSYVAKLRAAIEADPALRLQGEAGGNNRIYRDGSLYAIGYVVRAWESTEGEQYGGASGEAWFYVGELQRGERPGHVTDTLEKLNETGPQLRTDYTADEVTRLRAVERETEQAHRDAESALSPFGNTINKSVPDLPGVRLAGRASPAAGSE